MIVRLDPETAVSTATYAAGSQEEYAEVSEQVRALVSAGSRIDQGQFLSRIAHAKSFGHVGEPGWRPGPSTDEIGLAHVNWMRLARTFLLGEPPPPGGALPWARRAGRADARRVEVAPAGGS